jgi:hypothetical protein
MTTLTTPSSDLLAKLNGRLPSTPEEILETLRLAQESRLAGIPGVPAEEVIEDMRRIIAKHKAAQAIDMSS